MSGLTVLDIDPSDLPYAPDLTFSAGINWRFLDYFTLNLDCQYIDSMFVDSYARKKDAENTATVDNYFLVNAKLGYSAQALIPGVDGEVYLAVENLAAHHGSHSGVEKDLLPDAGQMASLFLAAGFQTPEITDMPGRYTAMAPKC